MNEQEKQIHTMVQRLTHLDTEYNKANEVKKAESREKIRKREQKI